MSSLIAIVPEAIGANCAYGGSKATSGPRTATPMACSTPPKSPRRPTSATAGPGPGLTWVDVTGTSAQALPNTGDAANNAARGTVTLPASASLAVGDVAQLTGAGAGGWTLAENAGQAVVTKNLQVYDKPVGEVWVPREESNRNWAFDHFLGRWQQAGGRSPGNGYIYTSTDSGPSWTARENTPGCGPVDHLLCRWHQAGGGGR